MRFMPVYLAGRQPCKTLISFEGYIGEPTIEDPCPNNCGGTVTFCEGCRQYHHSGGWETCGRETT